MLEVRPVPAVHLDVLNVRPAVLLHARFRQHGRAYVVPEREDDERGRAELPVLLGSVCRDKRLETRKEARGDAVRARGRSIGIWHVLRQSSRLTSSFWTLYQFSADRIPSARIASRIAVYSYDGAFYEHARNTDQEELSAYLVRKVGRTPELQVPLDQLGRLPARRHVDLPVLRLVRVQELHKGVDLP